MSVVRTRPVPSDPHSLAQAYQRWLYQDYAYRWTQLASATRAEYRSGGVAYHLTGFQYWMKYQLANLPDIAAWYKLDDNEGATTRDSSRNSNTATIIGASPATGLIGRALSFDGVNDKLTIPNSPSLNIRSAITIICYLQTSWDTPTGFQEGHLVNKDKYMLRAHDLNKYFIFYIVDATVGFSCTTALPQADPFSGCVVARYDGLSLELFVNGARSGLATAHVGQIDDSSASPLLIGTDQGQLRWDKSIPDNIIIFNRALDDTEILRHSLRRYPV